jgi:hypothetical protein
MVCDQVSVFVFLCVCAYVCVCKCVRVDERVGVHAKNVYVHVGVCHALVDAFVRACMHVYNQSCATQCMAKSGSYYSVLQEPTEQG